MRRSLAASCVPSSGNRLRLLDKLETHHLTQEYKQHKGLEAFQQRAPNLPNINTSLSLRSRASQHLGVQM